MSLHRSGGEEVTGGDVHGYPVPNFVAVVKFSFDRLLRTASHVPDARGSLAADNVAIVAVHLGKTLLEDPGPDRAITRLLGEHRPSITEGDHVIDHYGVGDAKRVEVHRISSWSAQIEALGENLLHATRVLGNGGCRGQEPAVAELALGDILRLNVA